MALFCCNACNSIYADHYPPDDSCLKCKRGPIRIITDTDTSTITHHKEEDQ